MVNVGDGLDMCQSPPPNPVIGGCHPRFGIILEQEISSFITAFYDYVPPEDWLFTDDSSVPSP